MNKQLIRRIRSISSSALLGIMFANLLLTLGSCSLASRHQDAKAGLIYLKKMGYLSCEAYTVNSVSALAFFFSLLSFAALVPKDLAMPEEEWFEVYPGAKVISLCSAAVFLLSAYFFRDFIFNYFNYFCHQQGKI